MSSPGSGDPGVLRERRPRRHGIEEVDPFRRARRPLRMAGRRSGRSRRLGIRRPLRLGDRRDRHPAPPQAPRASRASTSFAGRPLPQRALGPRRAPRRPAHRRNRHRLERRPDHRGPRSACRPLLALPAHGAMGRSRPAGPSTPRSNEPSFAARPRGAPGHARRARYESSTRASANQVLDGNADVLRGHPPDLHAAQLDESRPGSRACARSSAPTIHAGLQAARGLTQFLRLDPGALRRSSSLNRSNAIEPEGVRTEDGRLHELDVLVLCDGLPRGRLRAPDDDPRPGRGAARRGVEGTPLRLHVGRRCPASPTSSC